LVIGLTGQFGAGCTTVADYLEKDHKFHKYSLSDIVKDSLMKRIGKTKYKQLSGKKRRKLLQDEGNRLRKMDCSYLAKVVDEQIRKDDKKDTLLVIDSIRNKAEIEHFRNNYDSFFLLAIDAVSEARWQRVQDNYGPNKGQFIIDDMRDKGENEPSNGQQTELCVLESDIIINHDTQLTKRREWDEFFHHIVRYLDLMHKPGSIGPTYKELFMHQAYGISLKSACSKRQVGAVIVDDHAEEKEPHKTTSYMIASGCNNVPDGEENCSEQSGDPAFCYKDNQLNEYLSKVHYCPKCGRNIKSSVSYLIKYIKCPKCGSKIMTDFIPGKSLDVCRAVHAEEAAIIQAGRLGSSALEGTTLYTTTFPCLLCAKSIIDAGIKKVVYREPYPMEESMKMLDACGVKMDKHEGVNPWAFFKLYKKTIY
jgi:deoxycytidylate deaminase